MQQLSDEQKRYIVERLACFARPVEVQKELKELWNEDASLPRLLFYDATSPQGKRELSEELQTLFADARQAYLDDVDAVPVAHVAWRLRRIQAMLDDEKTQRNPMLCKDLLLQAAKDKGGMFTNRRIVEQTGNAPAQALYDMSKLSREELDTMETILAKAALAVGDTGGTGAA